MKSIFAYSDYRLFLNDFLRSSKAGGNLLTYDELGQKVGFTSKGFVTQIIQGKSKIPGDKIKKFARALGLKKKEQEYFELLVQFTQARTHRMKNDLFQQLVSRFKPQIRHIGPDQFEFYNTWYYSAIRSLLGYYPFSGDYKKLAQQLTPSITPGQAKKAVELLERLSLIVKKEDGFHHLTNRILSTGDTVESMSLINFQQTTMELAKDALENFPKEQRNSSTLTLGLSEEGYRAAVKKITALRKELLEIAQYDSQIDRVIQVNLHAFPLTRIGKEKQ